jgi:hypothetical protein
MDVDGHRLHDETEAMGDPKGVQSNFFRHLGERGSRTLCIPARGFADKRVEAKLMAHDWQPDFEQLVDEHQSMVFSLAAGA